MGKVCAAYASNFGNIGTLYGMVFSLNECHYSTPRILKYFQKKLFLLSITIDGLSTTTPRRARAGCCAFRVLWRVVFLSPCLAGQKVCTYYVACVYRVRETCCRRKKRESLLGRVFIVMVFLGNIKLVTNIKATSIYRYFLYYLADDNLRKWCMNKNKKNIDRANK